MTSAPLDFNIPSATQIPIELPMHVENELLVLGSQPDLFATPRVQSRLHPWDVADILARNLPLLLWCGAVGDVLHDGARRLGRSRVGLRRQDLESAAIRIEPIRPRTVNRRVPCLRQDQQ